MKALIIAHAYPPHIGGGAEVSTSFLAEGLARAGHEVHVLSCGESASIEQRNGVTVQRIPSPNAYWSFKTKPTRLQKLEWTLRDNWNGRSTAAVRAVIESVKPDILISSTLENFGSGAWLAAHQAGVPSVHILRNYHIMCANMAMHRNGRNCARACTSCNLLSLGKKMASQKVSGIIGLSSHTLQAHLVEGYFAQARSAVIPNFIPEANLPEASSITIKPVRRPPVFGFLGALSEHKGLGHLVAAYREAVKTQPARLLLAGSGESGYVERLKTELAGQDVEFLGWIDQKDFFRQIDCLIIPSLWHEPFGRVVLEAYAAGVPVIGAARGGIKDIIQHGHNGFLYEPDEPQALPGLISRIAQQPDLLPDLAKNAINTVIAYREASILPLYESFFEQTIRTYCGQNSCAAVGC
jgi:glycosyltransferase involved in cell wall biosynthesis